MQHVVLEGRQVDDAGRATPREQGRISLGLKRRLERDVIAQDHHALHWRPNERDHDSLAPWFEDFPLDGVLLADGFHGLRKRQAGQLDGRICGKITFPSALTSMGRPTAGELTMLRGG